MWLSHDKITKRLNNSKGLGISEAMLAMAVVAIAALAVSSFIIYQKRDASRLGKSTSCQEVLNWAINSIKSRDNKQTITDCFPWNIDPANGLIVATNYRCQSLDIDPGSTADNFVASYDPTLAGNTAVRGWVNAWNIQNTTQRLTYLINRKAALNENLCADPGTDWTDSLITQEFGDPSNVITNFTNPQLLLKITRLQSGSPLGANTCLPASTLQLRPRGLASVGGSNLNEDNSYKVDVTFNYVDQNLPKTCSRSTTIGYDGDSMPPSILDMNGGQNSVTLTNGNGVSFINT
ncbi:MAG: hypothetical protein IT289_13165, partial [Oligoflexia bacterium]|nr:hypothetical protein [Oligoflexia bacterium]